MSNLEVCIRGHGAVGLTLALALARQGLRVGVVGAAPAPGQAAAPDVRAYALNAASRRLLGELRVWDALPADAVTPVDEMRIEGDAPGGAIQFSAWQQGCEALAWIVDAAELEAALRTAARFAPHLTMLADDATAGLSDAPLTVLAEGKASASRAALGVKFERQAYGHTAIAARLVADAPHGGVARQWFRSPDVLGLLPFDAPQPASSYAIVWSVPDARADELMALGDTAFTDALMHATGGAVGTLRLASERAAWP
ncbi:MAG: 2-octaprenyl-3-methyl-6-methoxy-1,4-benzoquinol hydroxylase, partial [Aquabacterium sp.]|nr:2-octaprenyl-3-methyl-6-methoxy-1,4-benzoquinol hydroxylase [Aquabacterium sp.]